MVSGVEKTMKAFMESASKDDQQHSSVAIGVGSELRKARESNQLSQMDVAEQLYLDKSIISALERDDYSALPEAIFVKGYIRSYSHLVGLNPETLIKLYENSETEQPLPVLENVCKTKDQVSEQHALPRWQILSLVAVCLALLLFVYLFNSSEPKEKVVVTNTFEERVDVGDEIEALASENIFQNSESIEIELPEDHWVENNFRAGDSVPAIETESEPVVNPSVSVKQSSSKILSEESHVTMVLKFIEDSWVEITDSSGQRLYFNLAKSGSELNVSGVAPFDVLLGYAIGVTIQYNGKPFDLIPYIRGKMARFTLGKAGDKANTDEL